MGYLTHVDGRCYVCKKHTQIFCDYCRRYMCELHRIDRGKKFVFCKDCEEKKRQPVHSKRARGNPEIAEMFTSSKGYEYP